MALTPDRPVGAVTRELLEAVTGLAGAVELDLVPDEVPWNVPLDEDTEHATYDPDRVADYLAAATRAALVLGAFRAPFDGRKTAVNAWWGFFDLSVSLDSNDCEVAFGWWPGDAKYGNAAFCAYAARLPMASRTPPLPPPRAGTRNSASSSSIGMTSSRARNPRRRARVRTPGAARSGSRLAPERAAAGRAGRGKRSASLRNRIYRDTCLSP